jgi:D-alanyl-D-alanine carboxypeptidase
MLIVQRALNVLKRIWPIFRRSIKRSPAHEIPIDSSIDESPLRFNRNGIAPTASPLAEDTAPEASARITSQEGTNKDRPRRNERTSVPHGTVLSSSQISRFAIEARTGEVLLDEGGDSLRGPASLTKMALLYLAFDALKKGRIQLDDMISVPSRAALMRGSTVGLKCVDRVHIRDLIASIAVCSANDSAVALAICLAGSVRAMIRQTNELCQGFGLDRTVFKTVSGLHRDGQVTTARNMATLGNRLIADHADQRHWFLLHSFSFNDKIYPATNTLLAKYPGTNGIKTGTTPKDGAHLVASVTRAGREIIAVIMGSTRKRRDQEMITLLNEVLR